MLKNKVSDHTSKQFVLSVLDGKGLNPASRKVLDSAEQNRVLFPWAVEYNLHSIETEGEKWINKLTNTIKFINQVLDKKINYSITRTYKYIDYVTFDVDLFVEDKNLKKTIELFKQSGCQVESHDASFGGRISGSQVNVKKSELLTIDLHSDFTWQKRSFVDTSMILKDGRKKEVGGINVDVPSAEVEFLLCMADMGHERFNITLLDLIWLEGLSKEIKDWGLIFSQTKKNGWNRAFNEIGAIVNKLTLGIYNKKIIPGIKPKKVEYTLPVFIPIQICWLSYLENITHNKHFPLISFAYMHYCKMRYYLSGKRKMPFYDSWYKEKEEE